MNYFIFIVKAAIEDFKKNKTQTFLTSLGILIGVFSVVILTALGLGLKKYIDDQFAQLGKNSLFIAPGKLISGGSFNAASTFQSIKFDNRDLTKIRKIKGVIEIAPIFSKQVVAKSFKKTEDTTIIFSSEAFFSINGFNIKNGRFFNKSDIDKKSKVVVIGPKIAEKLFGQADLALDQKITASNVNFKIIGVLESKGGGGFGGPDYDNYIFSPYTSGYIFNPQKNFSRIALKFDDINFSVGEIKELIKKEMLKRYDEDSFSIIEPGDILQAVNSIFSVLNMVLVAIASISLLVGGIGIMNIMFVTVTEKTKEIGIRRAIGARKNDILYQFIIESTILSVLGGAMGLGLAFLTTLILQKFFPAYIDVNSVLLALGVSSAIGIFFGVFPAKKASDLSPIEAIRYE
ncbi:MAG: ABC transporter permease [Patescibacteria group bacterium]|nr:ABC transporter permease [Patescibacteria group bacterium]